MATLSTSRDDAGAQPGPARVLLLVVLAWSVPGGAHVALGHVRKGVVLGLALLALFVCGVAFGGRLFPFQTADPLVFLAALAEWGAGVPRLVTGALGWGRGAVVAVTYEYGNTFLITAGLLNALVVLDAYDLAIGRKSS